MTNYHDLRVTIVPTSLGITESDMTMKRSNSLNDSEELSPEPGSQSPTHTPPLTPALTPQREDTPAPENLSLRKSGSPQQTQLTLQPVDLVQPRPSPPLPSLAVSFLISLNAFKLLFNRSRSICPHYACKVEIRFCQFLSGIIIVKFSIKTVRAITASAILVCSNKLH